jgi:excisionase family DNA binding protein
MENDELLYPRDVAPMFGVDPKTIARWADSGKLKFVRTLGGHRRFRRSDIEEALNRNHN